tara:strand:- start:8 stop:445 length:438 start_codon:yes stop_codon:yes gene_type:complete
MVVPENLTKSAVRRVTRRSRLAEQEATGSLTAWHRKVMLGYNKNPFLVRQKLWSDLVAEADRQSEREINSLRLRKHPWVVFREGRAVCDLCGGSGSVGHLLHNCQVWKEVVGGKHDMARDTIKDVDHLLQCTLQLRSRKGQWLLT